MDAEKSPAAVFCGRDSGHRDCRSLLSYQECTNAKHLITCPSLSHVRQFHLTTLSTLVQPRGPTHEEMFANITQTLRQK